MKDLKLEVGKKYLTRNGCVAEIANYRDYYAYCFVGHIISEKGLLKTWTNEGFVLDGKTNEFDLIEELIEEDVEMKQIDINKKYRTRDGRDVEIIAVRQNNFKYGVIGIIENDTFYNTWTIFGYSVDNNSENHADLIEIKPYEDFKIDDKVLVRESNSQAWRKRYFAGISNNGKSLVFIEGATSWSVEDDNTVIWNECIKWEDRVPNMQIM